MFFNSEYPKLKSNLKAKSSSFEVWLSGFSAVSVDFSDQISAHNLCKLGSSQLIPQRFAGPLFGLALGSRAGSCGLQRLCGQFVRCCMPDELLQGCQEDSGKAP